MPDILHRVGIRSSPAEVYKRLTTRDGLAAWWTNDTQGDGNVDGVLQFRFVNGGIDMKVRELDAAKRVVWEVVGGPQEWIGTTVRFELKQEDEWTIILFQHNGWKEPVEFMSHCTTKWGTFLMSLKSLLETGKGASHPNDVLIGNWN
jgi:uncharacterized protein YndB with AHSA1/START domain